jgi:hypothetical protein
MWIERLELVSFGAAVNEKIEFGRRGINLVEEQSEQNVFLIPAVVLGILYGFAPDNSTIPKQIGDISRFRPKEGGVAAFLASMDCLQDGRSLRICRDFENNKLTITDCADGDKDVTGEYLADDSEPIGEILTKLTREQFWQKCLILAIGQRDGLSATGAISGALNSICDPASKSYGKALAVEVLEGYLNQFPYKSIQIKIDFLIHELEQQKLELVRKARALEEERKEMGTLLDRIAVLSPKLEGKLEKADANEYFQLCLRAAEIDGQVLHLRAQHVRLRSILHELTRLGNVDNFPTECQSPVEELWKRRLSHIEDYRTLEQELAPKIEEYEAYEREVTQRWEKLQSFTPEQAQVLRTSADQYLLLFRELNESKEYREAQEKDTKEANLDMSSYDEMRQTMNSLESRDANDAKSYSALIAGFRKQLSSSERGKSKAEATITEIEEQRRSKAEANAVLKIFKPTLFRQPELEAAQADLERHVARIDDLHERIRNLEGRIEALAQRAGIVDGSKLLEHVQAYSAASPQLQELERIDQLISQKRLACDSLKVDFEPYFRQAGRGNQEINAETIGALADDVVSCLRDFRSLNSTFGTLKLSKQQLEFLAAEIRGIDEALHELFTRASVSEPANIEASYTEFYGKVARYHHWRALQEEVAKAKEKYGFNPGSEDIHTVMAELEQERRQSWSRIHELVDSYPEIADATPPPAAELENFRAKPVDPELRGLRGERDELERRLKIFFDDYDEQYTSVLAMIEAVDHQVTTSRTCKLALEMAREVLEQLLMEDLSKILPKGTVPEDTKGEPLPLFLDAACLAQGELEFSLALRFVLCVIGPSRQTVILSDNRRFSLSKFKPILNMSPVPVHFAWRKPLESDSIFQRACSD